MFSRHLLPPQKSAFQEKFFVFSPSVKKRTPFFVRKNLTYNEDSAAMVVTSCLSKKSLQSIGIRTIHLF